MRKTEIAWLLVVLFFFTGCEKKKPEKKVGPSAPSKSTMVPTDRIRALPESKPVNEGFELKEKPVKQESVKIPELVEEVNREIRKIVQSTDEPANQAWEQYFKIALADNELKAELNEDEIWEALTDKLNSEKMPSIMYGEMKDQSHEGLKGLYGLYLASVLSSSEGGGEIHAWMKKRADDSAVKNIDLEIYKTIVSGIADTDSRPGKMYLAEWQKFSESSNLVYRMLAVQLGHFLTDQENPSPTGAERSSNLGKYYKSFLNDQSQEIRSEVLRAIKNLGKEASTPIIDAYRKTDLGVEDKIILDSIFSEK